MQLITLRHRQQGLTLVELMVGLVVSLIVLSGVSAVYVTTARGGADTVRFARLNQDARAIMDVIASDIRRAGYCGADPEAPQCISPPPDLVITSAGTCIRYVYERNAGTPADNLAGFRLQDGAIEMRISGGAIDDACINNAAWIALNDSAATLITNLEFSTTGSQCLNVSEDPVIVWPDPIPTPPHRTFPCVVPASFGGTPATGDRLVESRQITITLEAQDTRDTNSTVALTEVVKVRNNRIINAP